MSEKDKQTTEMSLDAQQNNLQRHFGSLDENHSQKDTVDNQSLGELMTRLNGNLQEFYSYTPGLTAAFVEQAANRIISDPPPINFDQICTEEGRKLEETNSRLKGVDPEIIQICLKLIKEIYTLNIENILKLVPDATDIFHRYKKRNQSLPLLIDQSRQKLKKILEEEKLDDQKQTDYICHEDELIVTQAIISGLTIDEIDIKKAEAAAKMAVSNAKAQGVLDQQQMIRAGIELYNEYIEKGDTPVGEVTVFKRRSRTKSTDTDRPAQVGESEVRETDQRQKIREKLEGVSFEESIRQNPFKKEAPSSQVLKKPDPKGVAKRRARKVGRGIFEHKLGASKTDDLDKSTEELDFDDVLDTLDEMLGKI
ncbi:hypothetical protein GF354_00840 [Candidatus Peregrinibacteria bacterium]|nr:hypothetical protein [Candidatus Peregrinibacteria bacterium]